MGYSVLINGTRPRTKKMVLAMMRQDPGAVVWVNDSLYGQHAGMTFTGTNLPEGLDDTFVGPDPHRERRWYGQIKVSKGKVTVR